MQFVVCMIVCRLEKALAALGHHLNPSVCKPSHHLTTGIYQHHPLVNFHLRVSILPGRCEIRKIFRVGGRIFAAAVSAWRPDFRTLRAASSRFSRPVACVDIKIIFASGFEAKFLNSANLYTLPLV